ncbi:MAG: dTMP kinase [Candidatus Levybacteria bacterium]|nr:dTMP kinase [Candidatus Levybacteria bacterium]
MRYHVEFDIELKKNSFPGKLVVIEGIDGSGKTTQAHKIVEVLNKKGIKAVFTKEPTDGIIARILQDVLSGKLKFSPVSFQYLFAADRAVHQEEIIKYLKKGMTVVSDRYLWSALAYGMLDIGAIDNANEKERLLTAFSILSMYNQFIVPDFTFYLAVPAEIAMARIVQKTQKIEIYEKEEKIEKLKKGYDWLSKKFAKEIITVDGEGPVEKVTERIISKLS